MQFPLIKGIATTARPVRRRSADPSGQWLMGENPIYRIHVPPKVPVENYWSFVVYDAETRSLLDNDQPFPSLA